MLATKRVPECDRIPSAKKWTTTETGIVSHVVLHNPCYSSTQLRDKLQCQLVPCSTRVDCDRHEVVSRSQSVYFAVLFAAALSAAAVALVDVSPMYELAIVSDMVICHTSGLPLVHGICVAPSGLLPSDLDKPTDSLTAGYCAFFIDLQMISFIWACWICLGALFLHDKPCSPCASTIEPQRQLCGWHVLLPRRKPTAIRMASSDSRSPTAVMGGACSQSHACSVAAAFNLATSVAVFVSSSKIFW